MVLWRCLSLKGVPRNSFPIPTLLIQTPEAQFVLTAVFDRSSSPELVLAIVPIPPFFSTLQLKWLWRQPYPHVKTVALILVQTGNSLTSNIRKTFCYWFRNKVSCKISPIIWNIFYTCFECVSRFRSVKCYCSTGLAWSRILFFKGDRIDRFSCLGSCILSGGRISEEMPSPIQKARSTFVDPKHLWRRRDTRLSTKGRV